MIILDLLLVVAIVGFIIACFGGVAAVIYFWWFGILSGLEHFGLPMIVGALLILMAIWAGGRLASIVFAMFGFWYTVTFLGWHWFPAACLYATSLVLVFGLLALGGIGAAIAGVIGLIEWATTSRRRRK